MASLSRVAVVGGGISGLAAAFRLCEVLPSAEIHLFETASRLGGVLDTVRIGGFLIERSADNFLTKDPHALSLCRRVGLGDQLLSPDRERRRAYVVHEGRLLPVPEGFHLMAPRNLRSFASSRIVSCYGKLRALAEPLMSRGPMSTNLDGDDARLSQIPDESVASFVRRRFGKEIFDRLVEPLVGGIYAGDAEKLSMAATLPEFVSQEQQHGSLLQAARRNANRFGQGSTKREAFVASSGARYSLFTTPYGGLRSLIDALAGSMPLLRVHLNSTVTDIRPGPGGTWELGRLGSLGPTIHSTVDEPPKAFRAVIVATPAHAAAQLLTQTDEQLAKELNAIEYAGCAVVSLGFRESQLRRRFEGFGFVLPRTENRPIIAASFASYKYPGRAPEGSVLIRVFIGGARSPGLLNLDSSTLLNIATEQLDQLLGVRGAPEVSDVACWRRSMPQYHIGHLARVRRVESLVSQYPRIALAGNAYYGVGIPQCVHSGEAAAERIAAQWQ